MIKNIMNMPRRILLFLLLCLGIQSLSSQDLVDCTYLLEDAREAYVAGMVELVPELLLECIQINGLSGEAKKEAYKLVINSYIFDYLSAEADSLMDGFVRDFPDYRAQNSDPQEFVFLLDAHLSALGIDPNEALEDPLTVVEDIKAPGYFARRNITKGAGEYGNTVGFKLGATLSIPNTLEGYSVGDPGQDESHFGLLPGFLVGAEANLILNRKMEASFGLLYNLTRFSYSASPLSFTSYRYVEAQHLVELPISLIYKLNPEDQTICYYLRGGFVPSYLISATGKGSRTDGDSQDDVVVDRATISTSRVKLNLNILLGGGVRIPLDNAFIFAEINWATRMMQANREDDRYQNSDLTWMLYHVDSDFRVHQLSICGGICWDLTKE
jgi:hypothetical protein